MPKLKFILLYLIVAFKISAQTVNLNITVPQYYIIAERTVIKKTAGTCIDYPAFPCQTISGLTIKLNYTGTINTVQIATNFLSSLPVSDSIKYYDTIPSFQSQFPILQIGANVVSMSPYSTAKGNKYNITVNSIVNTSLNYANWDTLITDSHDAIYTLKLKIKVRQNFDNSFTLPSHDKTTILATPRDRINNLVGTVAYHWEYAIPIPNGGVPVWSPIIGSGDTPIIRISGQDIFSTTVMNNNGTSVWIRVVGTDFYGHTEVSNVQVFSHRISSPHILSITPIHLLCNGGSNGRFKIKFDRPLDPQEIMNLFAKDTINYVDYSAVNLNNFDADTSFTWTPELLASTYQISMLGKYNGIATFTGSLFHYGFTTLTQPPELRFPLTITSNVSCKGGNNGSILVEGYGGVGNYKYGKKGPNDADFTWVNFSNTNCVGTPGTFLYHCPQSIDHLSKGLYTIKLRDGNGCYNLDSLGNEQIRQINIPEPLSELALNIFQTWPVTSADSSNGAIRVSVIGGTPRPEENVPVFPYTHQWRDSATNQVISNYTLDTIGGVYITKISNLPGGTYYFEAWDSKYENLAGYNFNGCKIYAVIRLPKPFPLAVNIVQKQPILCNGNNNAILTARASGGVPVDVVMYYFKWFKQDGAGNFQILSATDSTLSNAGPGIYKAEIKDKFNNTKQSLSFTIVEPSALTATTSFIQPSCFSNADGSATASGQGGTAPYFYEWSNSQIGPVMTNIPGGTYIVRVIDTRGCEKLAQVIITSPIELISTLTPNPVKCFNECNGSLAVGVTGGTLPYNFLWSTGSTSNTAINNLCNGTYWLRTSDNRGCVKTDTLVLQNPVNYFINAGPNQVICPNQNIPITTTIITDSGIIAPALSFLWSSTNGFTSTLQSPYIANPGTYYVTATNSSGCVKKDTVIVTFNNASAIPEFIVSTQAFADEPVLLANLSSPVPDSVHWIIPAGVTILSSSRNFCELRFADTGVFKITLQNFYPSGCVYDTTKKIHITTKKSFVGLGDQGNAFLKKFSVYPNPNNGNFTCELLFNATTKARLRLVSTLTDQTVHDQVIEGQYSYVINYNLPGLIAGTYILVIETAKGNFIYKVIKS
jgi:hypothetical protein